MVEGPQSVDSRSQERLESGDARSVRSSRPREVIRVGPWLFVGGVASLTLLFGREHSSRFGDCVNRTEALETQADTLVLSVTLNNVLPYIFG